MAGPTANLPVGLLDALGIKSGSYPRNLVETIQPTFEQVEILSASNCSEVLTLVGAPLAGLGNGNAFVVPPGEVWLVYGYGSQATTLATEALVMGLSIRPNVAGTGGNPIRKWDEAGQIAVGLRLITCTSTGPFWIAAGLTLGYFITAITTAGTIATTFTASILRCRR